MSLRVSLLIPLLLCAPLAYAQDASELAAMSSPSRATTRSCVALPSLTTSMS